MPMLRHTFNLPSAAAAIFLVLSGFSPVNCAESGKIQADVRKIWDSAPHSAFTDLIRFKGRFYCSFREGTGHVPGANGADGVCRVIVSDDGENWESAALLQEEGVDLRDPKLSVTPDGRVMVIMGGSYYDGVQLVKRHPRVAFSDADGANFGSPQPVKLHESIGSDEHWIWRVTWVGDTGYGVSYLAGGSEWPLVLLKTSDGVSYAPVAELKLTGKPNETTLRPLADGKMAAFVRREGGNTLGMVGVAGAPYVDWTWKEINQRVGGPNFIQLKNGVLVAGGRKYGPGGARTILAVLGLDGAYEELIEFPSGGDTSYPGLVEHDGKLWVSYYSSHEGKTSIYLATLPVSSIEG